MHEDRCVILFHVIAFTNILLIANTNTENTNNEDNDNNNKEGKNQHSVSASPANNACVYVYLSFFKARSEGPFFVVLVVTCS
jgi:hypothetical protein